MLKSDKTSKDSLLITKPQFYLSLTNSSFLGSWQLEGQEVQANLAHPRTNQDLSRIYFLYSQTNKTILKIHFSNYPGKLFVPK